MESLSSEMSFAQRRGGRRSGGRSGAFRQAPAGFTTRLSPARSGGRRSSSGGRRRSWSGGGRRSTSRGYGGGGYYRRYGRRGYYPYYTSSYYYPYYSPYYSYPYGYGGLYGNYYPYSTDTQTYVIEDQDSKEDQSAFGFCHCKNGANIDNGCRDGYAAVCRKDGCKCVNLKDTNVGGCGNELNAFCYIK